MTSSYSLSSLRMTATLSLLGGSYIIDRHVDVYSLAISEQGELYELAHTHLFELISQIGHTAHRLPIRAYDNIAKGSSVGIDTTQARARSRRTRNRAHDDDSFDPSRVAAASLAATMPIPGVGT